MYYGYKTAEEKEKLKKSKKQFEDKLRIEYGENWKQLHRQKCTKIVITY